MGRKSWLKTAHRNTRRRNLTFYFRCGRIVLSEQQNPIGSFAFYGPKGLTGVAQTTTLPDLRGHLILRWMMKPYHNPDWLRQKHHVEELSTRQMAQEAGCSQHATIRYWMEKLGIPIRSRDEAMKVNGKRFRIPIDASSLRQLYLVERKTISEIAAEFGTCYPVIWKRMAELGIPRRSLSEAATMGKAKSKLDPGKEWLFQKYWTEGQSTYKMAKRFDCAQTTITKWMEYYNIPRRNITENHALGLYNGICQSPTKPERSIMEALDNLGIKYEFQFLLGSYHYDFKLKKWPILFEFDGQFWHHSEWAKTQGRPESDARKTKLAEEMGYHLIRFTEVDFENETPESQIYEAIVAWVESLGLRQTVEIPEEM